MFYFGGIDFDVGPNNDTTTTIVSDIIGNNMFKKHNYAPDMPCIWHIFAARSVPFVTLDPNGSLLNLNFDTQFLCNQDTPGDYEYYQVATV